MSSKYPSGPARGVLTMYYALTSVSDEDKSHACLPTQSPELAMRCIETCRAAEPQPCAYVNISRIAAARRGCCSNVIDRTRHYLLTGFPRSTAQKKCMQPPLHAWAVLMGHAAQSASFGARLDAVMAWTASTVVIHVAGMSVASAVDVQGLCSWHWRGKAWSGTEAPWCCRP